MGFGSLGMLWQYILSKFERVESILIVMNGWRVTINTFVLQLFSRHSNQIKKSRVKVIFSNCAEPMWQCIKKVYKHLGQRGLATLLPTRRPAGIAPEVNMRNQMHRGDKPHNQGINPDLKPSVDIIRCPKQGYQWLHKKELCPPLSF